MSFKSKALIVGFAAALSLSACATGYGTNLLGLGMKTKEISENIHKVSYQGNGYTSEQRVWNYWFNRCAELTKEKGYDVFTLLDNVEFDSYKSKLMPNATASNGDYYMMTPDLVLSEGAEVLPAYYYTTITTYSMDSYVVMYKTPLPPDAIDEPFFDPDTVLKTLQPFIESKGKTAPPYRKLLMMRSLLAGAIKTGEIKEDDVSDEVKALVKSSDPVSDDKTETTD